MNPKDVLALHDHQLRRHAQPDDPHTTLELTHGVLRQTSTTHGWNGVIWSDLDHTTADAAIADQLRHYAGRAFEWKLYAHDQPTDLAQRLQAAGSTPEPAETLMAADIRDQPTTIDLPEGVHLRPVTDTTDIELMLEVHQQAFGTSPAHLGHHLRTQLADAPHTIAAVLAMAGERPVSAARLTLHPGTDFAGLWSGGTAPDWRGRGIYRALVAYRARIAAERGYRYLQVDASDDSRPILERLGFIPLTTTTPHVFFGESL
ncbi:GNAT family N-acetyltransferase [Nonomuraea sp. NPDC049152]|uniref:GNAT family N-acetyltransferase n=1 Tax=Nonomuraea sp. NPDC049152 TaxID=3154350 RepID=UPI003401B2F4